MQQRESETPAELVIAALYWPVDTPWEQHKAAFLAQHGPQVREILWGGPGNDRHIRTGFEGFPGPHEVALARTGIPTEVSAEGVLEALPSAFEAPPFRGFLLPSRGFLDWHLVSHQLDLDALEASARATEGIDWFFGVEAEGQAQHTHALLSFRHARTQAWIKAALGLPGDTKLSPIHHSFRAAAAYLVNQATRTAEFGEKPSRDIMVDGLSRELNAAQALRAIEQGNPTDLVAWHSPKTRDESKALQRWMGVVARRPRVEHRLLCESRAEAIRVARELALGYTDRVHVVNHSQLLAPFVSKPPSLWVGQEVVVLEDVPAERVAEVLGAPWLRAVPEVLYTVQQAQAAGSEATESVQADATRAASRAAHGRPGRGPPKIRGRETRTGRGVPQAQEAE